MLNVCLGAQSQVTEDGKALGKEPDIGYRVGSSEIAPCVHDGGIVSKQTTKIQES